MEVRLASPITFDSIVDGPGIRAVLWFQGCKHHCPGCHNPETWNLEGGNVAPIEDVVAKILANPLQTGLTLSGGDPLFQPEAALEIIRQIRQGLRERGRDKFSIWLYTGYTIDAIKEMNDPTINAILDELDSLVEGPFIMAERTLDRPFVGSRNQRIIEHPGTWTSDVEND